MLDHEEKFLFKEEILHLGDAIADGVVLGNRLIGQCDRRLSA